MAAIERSDAVGGLTLQRRLHLLGNDRAPEDPGKCVADGGFELALDALHEAHVTALRFLSGWPSRS
jgi:hypothetical protein